MAKLIDYETWREQNEARGRAEGEMLTKRADVLAVLHARFTPVPDEWVTRVEAMRAMPELDALFHRLLEVESLDQVQSASTG